MGSKSWDSAPALPGSLTQELVRSATRLQREFIERLSRRTARAGEAGELATLSSPPEFALDQGAAGPPPFEAPLGTLFSVGPPEQNTLQIRWGGPADRGYHGQVTAYLSDVLQFEAAAQQAIPTAREVSQTQELGRQIAGLAEKLHARRSGLEVAHNPGWQNRELAEMFGEGNYAPLYLANYGTHFVALEDANAVSIQFAGTKAFSEEALVPLSDVHAFALALWSEVGPASRPGGAEILGR